MLQVAMLAGRGVRQPLVDAPAPPDEARASTTPAMTSAAADPIRARPDIAPSRCFMLLPFRLTVARIVGVSAPTAHPRESHCAQTSNGAQPQLASGPLGHPPAESKRW